MAYYKVFDVAKWSTADIESIMNDQGIKLKGKAKTEFIDDVIQNLSDYFDASVGINWDVIDFSVSELARELEGEEE